MNPINIGERIIDVQSAPFIVAEASINHNGELEKAYEMILVAKQAGVDAVKFQTFKGAEIILDPSVTFTYRSQGKEVTESMQGMFKRNEFTRDQWFLIKKRCDEEGILFLSTPQNYSDLEILLELGVSAIKVGSDDFVNLPLLKSYAQTGLPLIVSCGMSNLAEVYQALDTIGSFDGYPTILLLCTSQYPTQPEDVNLKKIHALKNAFPMVQIGFSDHTQGPLASALAVGFGAVFFEKHFTLSHDLPGPDHWFSEDPKGLNEWVHNIRVAWKMLGSALVRATESETEMKMVSRRSIVVVAPIKKGEIFTPANIAMRRPGTGVSPALYEKVVGLHATKDIAEGVLLQLGDFQ